MSNWAGLALAAGKGSRFQQETGEALPKVLRPVMGKPLICFVLDSLSRADIREVTLIIGFMADRITSELGDGFRYVLQTEQKGSGHAVACAKDAFDGFVGNIVVMCGDSPLFSSDTIAALMREHENTHAAITLASAVLDDPHGYGRILRDPNGSITGIMEEKCANADQRAIKEVNGGAYAFDSKWLFENIDQMAINNAGEYNLTDMVRVAIQQSKTIAAVKCDPIELLGVNTPEQLIMVENILRNYG